MCEIVAMDSMNHKECSESKTYCAGARPMLPKCAREAVGNADRDGEVRGHPARETSLPPDPASATRLMELNHEATSVIYNIPRSSNPTARCPSMSCFQTLVASLVNLTT
jgi:hypothetical protein